MKKITLLILSLGLCFAGWSQTLNQNASWPNTNWTVTGTFNTDPLAFEADPTLTANFAFDDDDAGNGSDDQIAAESPIIDLTAAFTAGETWVTISGNFVYNYNFDDILQFEYWDADTSTWNIIGTPINADTAGAPTNNFCSGTTEVYTTDIVNIVGFTPTQLSGFRYRIYYDDFVGGAGYEWGFCFDSPTITSATPPSCPDPSVLTASNITDTTADLAWTENGSATAWDVEIVTTGTAASGTPTSTGVSNPYTATMLAADTEYDYYLRSNCGVDGTSAWIGPLTFRTECAPIAAPYTEDFELFTTSTSAFTSGNCWTGSGGSYFWESAAGSDTSSTGTGPAPSITTGNYFFTEATSGSTGNTTDLISPLVDLSALTAPALSFNYHMFGADMGTLDVLVNGTTNVWTLSGEQQMSDTDPWGLAIVDLSAFAGQTISVTFRGTKGVDFESDMAIDNVDFGEAPSCFVPSNVTVLATTIDGATIDFTNSNTSTNTNIEYGAPGFTQGTGTTLAQTTIPFTVTGLMSATTYNYYLQSDCGMGDVTAWVGPFSFTTDCVAVADFNENFDGVSTPNLPNCWDSFSTVLATGTQPYVETSTLADETAPNGVRLYSGSLTGNIGSGTTNEGETILVSPQLNNLSAGTHRLRFFADAGTSTSTLEVGTITDPTDPSTFTLLSALAPTTTHSEFIVNFDSYTGSDQYVAFRHIFVSTFDSMYLDNIVWQAIPPCVAASDIVVTSSTDTSVVLGWTNNAMATASTITYGAVGFDPLTAGTSIPGGADTATITGLMAETAYDFYVTQDCSSTGDGFSNIAGPTSFTTPCAAIAAPYFVDFENFTAATSGFVLDQCWQEVSPTAYDWAIDNSGGTTSSGTGPSGAYSGSTFMFVEASNGATGDIATVRSPAVDLSFLMVPSISFYYHMYGSQITSLDVGVSTDNGATFTTELTITGQQQMGNADAWLQSTIDLSAYANQTVIVSFSTTKGTGTFDYEGDVSIDDVEFKELPPCIAPNLLTATNIDGFSADLGWTDNATATAWNIELVDITAGGTVTGTATNTGVTNPFNITGLTTSNDYEFYVQADCGVDGTSTWAGPFAFTTTVACPDPTALTATNVLDTSADLGWTAGGSETVWDVEIVDITAGGTVTGAATASGVANPYSVTGLTADNDYEFYVRADCVANGTSTWVGPFAFTTKCSPFTAPYTEDFENAGAIPNCWALGGDDDWEFNTSGPNHVGNGGTLSGTTASGGYYAVLDDSNPTATDGQLNSPLVDVSGLSVPALTFYEISDNEGFANATLTVSVWDGAAWNVMGIYNTNTVGWELKVIDLSTLTFTGPAQARFSIADSGSFYDDIAIDDVSFDELPVCNDVTAVTIDSETSTTITVSWTENSIPAATAWEVVAVVSGGSAPVPGTSNVTTNPFTITSLTANTSYDIYVRADCSTSFVGPITTATDCDVFVPDSVENFSTFVPDCWEVADGGDLTTGPTNFGTSEWEAEEFAHVGTGNGAVDINLYRAVVSDWILSPLYDLSAGGYELNLDIALTDYNNSAAGVMGSDDFVALAYTTDGMTWTTLQIWDLNNQPATAGETYNDPLTGINSATVRFGIYATDGAVNDLEDYDVHIDNFQVRTPPTCPDTSNLTLVSNTDVEATINFDSGNATSAGNYEYSLTTVAGATPAVSGAWTDVAGATPNVTYTITGLTAETDYFVHVREVCAVGNEGSWSTAPLFFTTSCAAVSSFPYTTDFTNNVPNACWAEAGSGEIVDGPMGVGSSDWKDGRAYTDFSGTVVPSNVMNIYQTNTDREWLISERYDMAGTSNDVLSVEVAVTDYQFSGTSTAADTGTMDVDDQVDLLITTDGGATWTSLITWNAGNQPSVTGTREFIDLSSYTGTVQFAFFASDGATGGPQDYDFHVGMFIIDGTAGNEDVFASTLSLYPNPVNGDVVTISMGQDSASSIEVAVFNTLGQQVMTRSFDQVNHSINIDNISSLSNGMYFVKVTSGSQQATLKFIKE